MGEGESKSSGGAELGMIFLEGTLATHTHTHKPTYFLTQ